LADHCPSHYHCWLGHSNYLASTTLTVSCHATGWLLVQHQIATAIYLSTGFRINFDCLLTLCTWTTEGMHQTVHTAVGSHAQFLPQLQSEVYTNAPAASAEVHDDGGGPKVTHASYMHCVTNSACTAEHHVKTNATIAATTAQPNPEVFVARGCLCLQRWDCINDLLLVLHCKDQGGNRPDCPHNNSNHCLDHPTIIIVIRSVRTATTYEEIAHTTRSFHSGAC